jgi:RNA-directed DNA polymerase
VPVSSPLPSPIAWKRFFESRGLDDELIQAYLKYIRPLSKKKLPVIFDEEHIQNLLGRKRAFIVTVTESPRSFYRFFEIPKKSGGFRQISAPYPSLLECQRWILNEILDRLPSHRCAKGYVLNRSIKDHASAHLGENRELLILDMKDFFPSIQLRRVVGFFSKLGYTKSVSLVLAQLCCLDDCLPQGAPTSASLSNKICWVMDQRLHGLARKFRMQYTRYADDLCFSGEKIPAFFSNAVEEIVNFEGFRFNELKSRKIKSTSSDKVITGLNISGGFPRPSQKFRRSISHEMHFIERFGLLSHLSKRKIADQEYLSKLRGKLEYWRFIEPDNEEVKRYINKIRELMLMST